MAFSAFLATCLAIIFATRRRTMSPTTISLTTPSGLFNAVNLHADLLTNIASSQLKNHLDQQTPSLARSPRRKTNGQLSYLMGQVLLRDVLSSNTAETLLHLTGTFVLQLFGQPLPRHWVANVPRHLHSPKPAVQQTNASDKPTTLLSKATPTAPRNAPLRRWGIVCKSEARQEKTSRTSNDARAATFCVSGDELHRAFRWSWVQENCLLICLGCSQNAVGVILVAVGRSNLGHQLGTSVTASNLF